MATNREIYESIKNPLENTELYEILLDQFSKNYPIYNILTSVYRSEKKRNNINRNNKQILAMAIFNYWSSNIQEISESNLLSIKNNPVYKDITLQEFRELKSILKRIGTITSYQQLEQVLKSNSLIRNYNSYLESIMNENNEWIHINSMWLDEFEKKDENVQNRFYLNIENEDLHAVVGLLIKKITKKGLPYHFKFSTGIRDDSIVIYTDNNHFNDYVELLRELRNENKELFKRAKKPPILTGKIDEWIGYGSEPTENGESYTGKRAAIMEKTLNKIYYAYLSNNQEKKIIYNNMNISIIDCIALRITQGIVKKLKDNNQIKSSDINSKAEIIFYDVKRQLPEVIRKIRANDNSPIVISSSKTSGVSFEISGFALKREIQSLAPQLFKSNIELYRELIRTIALEFQKEKIDIKKTCFDISQRNELFRLDKKTVKTTSTYEELRSIIKNPIDDKEIIKKIIKEYSKTSMFDEDSLYSRIATLGTKMKNPQPASQTDRDNFCKTMFELWRKEILSLTDAQISMIIKKEKNVDEDFRKIKDYVRRLPQITTEEQYLQLALKGNNDLLKKYGWRRFFGDGWLHVKSRYIKGKLEEEIDIKHRLYLNANMKDQYKIAQLFIDKCKQKNIPFYLKMNSTPKDRDDTIVIYSDNEHLMDYISILKEMKRENPNLISNINEPPLLTGKIDNWIGYGKDPESGSYTSLRVKEIYSALNDSIVEWINSGKSVEVQDNEKLYLMNREDLFAKFLTKSAIEETISNSNGKIKIEDIDKRYANELYMYVKRNLNEILQSFKDKNQLYSLGIGKINGKDITLSYIKIKIMIREFAQLISESDDEDLINITRNNIRNRFKRKNIDPDMICFEQDTKMELDRADQRRRQQQIQSMFSEERVNGTVKKGYNI